MVSVSTTGGEQQQQADSVFLVCKYFYSHTNKTHESAAFLHASRSHYVYSIGYSPQKHIENKAGLIKRQ